MKLKQGVYRICLEDTFSFEVEEHTTAEDIRDTIILNLIKNPNLFQIMVEGYKEL